MTTLSTLNLEIMQRGPRTSTGSFRLTVKDVYQNNLYIDVAVAPWVSVYNPRVSTAKLFCTPLECETIFQASEPGNEPSMKYGPELANDTHLVWSYVYASGKTITLLNSPD